ncbi:esterase/lipase family protein [Enterococcus sp. LJL128]
MLRMFSLENSVPVFVYAFLYNLCLFLPLAGLVSSQSLQVKVLIFVLFLVCALVVIHKIPKKTAERKHLSVLYKGCYSLKVFVVSCSMMVLTVLPILLNYSFSWQLLVLSTIWIVFLEALLFWNGMLRVYLSSVQLGLKLRIMAAVCGWVPVVNIYMLLRVIRVVEDELAFEFEKDLAADVEAASTQCQTKYPLLLVHGIFFRDIKYLNYWGRIPRFLKQRGAVIHYGNQESAQSAEYCGKQLAQQIENILKETGCEKVNIIAHSKGGLDSRYAISNYGMDKYVASLTTINTPHHGCIFADYLLKKAPQKMLNRVEKIYNGALGRLGDQNPDFLVAVTDLSDETCKTLNAKMPDKDDVYYQGVASYVNKAAGGKFPLNIFYPVVRHFDGKNDGLVSVESASYFENTKLVGPIGKRGISHADMIDLNRENIDGFDVRVFYQDIIVDLKNRGF